MNEPKPFNELNWDSIGKVVLWNVEDGVICVEEEPGKLGYYWTPKKLDYYITRALHAVEHASYERAKKEYEQ